MSNDNKTTDELIGSLTSELKEIKVMCHPLKRAIPWCIYAVLYSTAIVYYLGFRHDINERLYDSVFVYEILLVLSMSLSAAFCSLWMCVPDMRGQKWMISIPFTLLASFALWLTLKVALDGFSMPTPEWHHCHNDSILIGLIPAIAIWFLSMRGKTTHPLLMTMMNVIAVGGLGYIGTRISCGADDMGHISFFHILPYILIGSLAGLISRKCFKW